MTYRTHSVPDAAAAWPPGSPGVPHFLYRPLVRRVLVRSTLAWLVLRAVLEGLAHQLHEPELRPVAALVLIGCVLAIEQLHARAMRELVFRANAGIGTAVLLGPLAVLLLGLEALFRVLR
ncbi:MAG: hypothetical protein FIB01_07875 [Gemmatimonadetes bacterium]|nr:hypothetical protein [Gemmatimonadota bacterium]